ncbi:MAG: IclR family transcriptional regulator [Acidimicrobiia bacterium]
MERIVSGIGVLDKAMEVLSALEVGPASLAELVEATGLPRATTHRLAVALEVHGMVRRDRQGRFHIGYRVVSLGRAAGDRVLVDAASVALEDLRRKTGESVQLFVRDGRERVCLLSLESPNELRTIIEHGARLPIDRGSAGKVLADDWSPGRSGEQWAQSAGEREPGVSSVSAPVRAASGEIIAAVCVSGPIERLGRQPGNTMGSMVVRAARSIERNLG